MTIALDDLWLRSYSVWSQLARESSGTSAFSFDDERGGHKGGLAPGSARGAAQDMVHATPSPAAWSQAQLGRTAA